ncbi:MAG: DUF1015 family protein [Terriglobales bacterium]
MAEIRPFRALRYDPAKVNLQDVVTQPYDKITPAMQQGYLDRNPANFIRFELPPPGNDPYEGAREFLAQARQSGLVRLEDRPAIYVYDQWFQPPVHSDQSFTRRAIIALGRLYDYSDGVIFRHEQTLTAPKRDREQLLKTTRVQSGLLFMMYDDPAHTIESLQPGADVAEFVDDLGIRQRLWVITDPDAIAKVQRVIGPLPLFIADGHHRYETALSLRRSGDGRHAEDFAMMALVNLRSEGLMVLPTHRTIFGLDPQRFAEGMKRLVADMRATRIDAAPAPTADVPRSRFIFSFATADGEAWKVDLPRDDVRQRLPGRPCELNVEALHSMFDQYFGISAADAAAETNIRYFRHPQDALRDLASGAQVAFFLRPLTLQSVRDRSIRGELLPQKSTDFYPKMNSGLTLYSWDESFEPTLATPARVGHPPQGAAR